METKKVSKNLTVKNEKNKVMHNEQKVSETLNETQEIVNNDVDTKSEENAKDDVAVETPTIETLTAQIKDAKKVLSSLNDKYDFDETNTEIIAKENEISNLLAERKKLERELEKQRLDALVSETLANAKNDLIAKLGITNELLETLIANAKNPEVKDTLIQSFNTVFGKKPLILEMGVTGTKLAKQSAKSGTSNGEFNITKNVKAMLTAGNSPETIINTLLANTDMDETKAKKRLNDIKWGWEIENGLREKPNK